MLVPQIFPFQRCLYNEQPSFTWIRQNEEDLKLAVSRTLFPHFGAGREGREPLERGWSLTPPPTGVRLIYSGSSQGSRTQRLRQRYKFCICNQLKRKRYTPLVSRAFFCFCTFLSRSRKICDVKWPLNFTDALSFDQVLILLHLKCACVLAQPWMRMSNWIMN